MDAIFYVVRVGIAWRQLPSDFPPAKTLYDIRTRWVAAGAWQRVHDTLRDRLRVREARNPTPTAAIIDSQSIQGSDSVPRGSRGYDAGNYLGCGGYAGLIDLPRYSGWPERWDSTHGRHFGVKVWWSDLFWRFAGGVADAAQNIYSFDGNAGGTASIAEMLLQSDGEAIELLPALPTAWADGEVTGLRARGGYEVSIRWQDGKLDSARFRALSPAASTRAKVRYGSDLIEIDIDDSAAVIIRPLENADVRQ